MKDGPLTPREELAKRIYHANHSGLGGLPGNRTAAIWENLPESVAAYTLKQADAAIAFFANFLAVDFKNLAPDADTDMAVAAAPESRRLNEAPTGEGTADL